MESTRLRVMKGGLTKLYFIVVALAYLTGSRWALRYVRWWWGKRKDKDV
jgi:hypothetical protein